MLVVVTAVSYLPVAKNDFVSYDDAKYVYDNPRIAHGVTTDNLGWAFTTTEVMYWHPLTLISHMLDVSVFGMNPHGHHVSSLVLHTLNVLLLYAFLLAATGARWPSMIAAAIFAVHPLNVDSVAWIAERKNVLSTLFLLLTLNAYACHARRPRAWTYALVALLYVLGLMCKPMLVTLPAILLLMDYWPLRRLPFTRPPESPFAPTTWPRAILEKLPLLVPAVAIAAFTYVVHEQIGVMEPLTHDTLGPRIANCLLAFGQYVRQIFIPVNLAVFYPRPRTWTAGPILLATLLLAGGTIAAIVSRRRAPYFTIGWFWFAGTLVPVIGIVQVGPQLTADRYAYVPMIGLIVAVVWTIARVARSRPAIAKLIPPVVAIMLAAEMTLTWRQCGHWRDTQTLFRHAIDVTDDNYLAHFALGTELIARGDLENGANHYFRAIEINPAYAIAYVNLAEIYARGRDPAQALKLYDHAIALDPRLANAYTGRGIVLDELGQTAAAIDALRTAIRLNPHDKLAIDHLRRLELRGR